MTSEELLAGLSTGVTPSSKKLSAVGRTEQKIATRPSAIKSFFPRAKGELSRSPFEYFGPMGAVSNVGMAGLSAVAEGAETVPANIGLGLQQRKGFFQTAKDVGAGLTGNRPAKLSDIAEASDIPIIRHPVVASGLGLAASLGTGLFTKVGRAASARVSEEVAGHVTGAASLATVGSRAKLAQRVGSIPEAAREKLSERFGAAIDEAAAKQTADPSLLFDLQDVGQTLQSVKAHLSSGVRHAASDAALELADNPSFGQNVGLELARQVKAGIQRSPEINRVTEAGRVLRQARDSIRAQEVEKLGLGETFKEFGTGMKAYRQVQPRVKRLGVSSPVTSGLKGMTESEGTRKSLEHLANVGGKRHGFAEVLGAARTAGTQQVLGKAARFLAYPAAFAAGGYLGARKFLSPRSQ